MIEADEEERSMRRMSRMRKMRMTTALTTTTVMNDEKELSALPTEVRSAQLQCQIEVPNLCFSTIRFQDCAEITKAG